jgi:hypothetical protein
LINETNPQAENKLANTATEGRKRLFRNGHNFCDVSVDRYWLLDDQDDGYQAEVGSG